MLNRKLIRALGDFRKPSRPGILLMILALTLAGCLNAAAQPSNEVGNIEPVGVSSPSPDTSITEAQSRAVPSQAAATPTQTLAELPAGPPAALPTATVTPAPQLRQVTQGACCGDPSWSPDSQRVMFIDRPSPDAPAGLWGIGLDGGAPQFVEGRLGIFSPDMQLRAYPSGDITLVERLSTGERWSISNGGRVLSFSPDGVWLAWTAGQSGPPFDVAQREVWISRTDGSQARKLVSVTGGGFVAWFPDGRLLVSGRSESADGGQAYWAVTVGDGELAQIRLIIEIQSGSRLRGAQLSPDGNWLVYMLSFSDDPTLDGLWLLDTRSGQSRRLEVFGGYRWRDGGRLLVVPLDLEQAQHKLLQVDATSGAITALSDPAITPFKIANGDWSVSPDGRHVVFVSAYDQNLWLLTLPPD